MKIEEAQEQRVEVTGGSVWTAQLGPSEGTPVLLLHGGPGAASYYMIPLAERLAEHRPVFVYDQLGCGRSDQPDDTSLWTVDRSVEEVDQVRAALGLGRCHLLGQSWGGWLSIEYMTRGATGIERLVLASTSASIPEFMAGARGLIEQLPEPHRSVLIELGDRGEYDHPDYLAAVDVFYHRHLCRMEPWPEALVRSGEQMDGNQVYLTMNGPTEFDVIGLLREWDRTADLGRIRVPTLVTCGRYDEITPSCSETITRGIPDARMHVFEESAHCAHLEEADDYARIVEAFLSE
ncbi:MAG TPA: proline iminopeptidase-family hydrolase [Gaiellales bacterium]|nr:proline iminopeptidase-family hydrolase [Gaiellales bacterium]